MDQEVVPAFRADAKLTPLEEEFVRRVEAGEEFKPPIEGGAIRGGLIRATLMGTPLKHHPGRGSWRPRAVQLTRRGVRIAGGAALPSAKAFAPPLLRIWGPFDLTALAAPNGGFLPPLELEGCIFDSPLHLSGLHLQSLSLRNCRFSLLAANGAKIDGDVTVSRCRPRMEPVDEMEARFAGRELVARKGSATKFETIAPQSQPALDERCDCPLCSSQGGSDDRCGLCCVIDFRSAAVSGGLEISNCYLKAPGLIGRTYRTPTLRDSEAVRLGRIQVRDSILITRCAVIGRTSFVSAEIDDDVRISGGKFYASAERVTIDLQLATIGGLLAFQAKLAAEDEEEEGIRAFPLAIVGQVSGIDLDAGEVWVGEGFYFASDPDKRGSYPTIDFAKADVKRSFKVGVYHPHHADNPARPSGEARIHGEICLVAANIGKNLELHGLGFDSIVATLELDDNFHRNFGVDATEDAHLKLRAHGLKVDRRVYISHAHFRDAQPPTGTDTVPGSQASPGSESVAAAIDLWKSTIGTGFRFVEGCTCVGALRLNNCVIGREVIIAGGEIEPSTADFVAHGIRAGDIPMSLDISESTINGHVKIGRRVPKSHPHATSGPTVAVTVGGGISLESTEVEGSLLLAHLTIDLRQFEFIAGDGRREGQPTDKDRAPERIAFNLRDCRCGSDLEVHALHWKLPKLSVRENRLLSQERRHLDRLLPWRHKGRFACIDECSHAVIDLRGFQCSLLIDGLGSEWGLIYRLQLKLAGIRIEDVEPPAEKPPHSNRHGADPSRRRWLGFQHLSQEIVDETETLDGCAPPPGMWNRFWKRFFCCTEDDFIPQAYDVFSAAYRKAGEDRAAEAILVEKKNVQNALRFQRLREGWYARSWPLHVVGLFLAAGLLWVLSWMLGFVPNVPEDRRTSAIGFFSCAVAFALWPWLVALFQVIFRAGFRYGLSPDRALLVFVGFILLGWLGLHYARNGGFVTVTDWPAEARGGRLNENIALVLEVARQPELSDEWQGEPREHPHRDVRGAATRVERRAVYAEASPCNLDVSNLLYAVDLFIPLIDLDQEHRCTIRDALPESQHDRYFPWRLAKALYELLGWIVTSLVILTVTGVLRRDLER